MVRLARARLPAPRAREVMDAAPVEKPIASAPTIMTTAKVKPIAASSSVPRRETNRVSVRLNTIMANVPAMLGRVSQNRWFLTFPVSSLVIFCRMLLLRGF